MKKSLNFVAAAVALSLCGCNIVDMSTRPSTLEQPKPIYTGFNKPWMIYDDSLNTAGGIQTYGDYWRLTTIDLASASLPAFGSKCIKLTFDPTVSNPPPSAYWCDFQLIHASDFSKFSTTPGVDLSSAGYTTCNFYARMTCTATVLFAGQTANSVKTVNSTWQQFSINLPPPASQTAVTVFFRAEQPSPLSGTLSSPVDLYIDQISYQ